MSENSKIEWTTHTWNPWQGCQKVSPGCDNCYMFRDKARYGQDPETVVRSKPPTFRKPLKWNREAREAGRKDLVFVASWADFFSREADAWRDDAWAIIRECDSLIFQVLTKRHGRITANLPADWGKGYPNVWLGVSGENQEWAERRVAALERVPAAVRFLSYEPALGPLDLRGFVSLLDWVIVGGESGPGARPFDLVWAREVIRACRATGTACFVKQLGARPVELRGTRLRLHHRKGADMAEWPADLRVREYPGGYGD